MKPFQRIKTLINKTSLISSTSGKHLNFSRRVVLSFTGIVLVPLILLFVMIFVLSYKQALSGLQEISNLEVNMNTEKVYENIQSCFLIEKMVRANSELMLFITQPENRSEEEVIRTVKEESHVLERILSVEPSIYAVRIFTDSPVVPERFPVILNSSRENLTLLEKWEFNYVADYIGGHGYSDEPSACHTTKIMNGRRSVGYLQVAVRMNDFFQFLSRKSEPWQSDHVLKIIQGDVGKRYEEIAVSSGEKKDLHFSDADLLFLADLISKNKFQAGKDYPLSIGRSVIMLNEIPELGIALVHTVDVRMVAQTMTLMMLLSLTGLLFAAVCFFLIVRHTSYRMFSGVYYLMEGMQKVSQGDLNVQLQVYGAKEVREAQSTFNNMTRQLVNQIEQIKTEQQLIADTEMKAMQNQINAHFLYNVLETIHMQAVLADNDDVAQSILILGKMLRYCLRWRIHTVTLSDEMEYINAYVQILNIRNDYTITLEAEIPESLQDLRIPKMIIQPFVENSFIHGIEPLSRDSVIRIYPEIDEEHGKLWLCVKDSGCGMGEDRLKSVMEYLSQEKYERDSTGSIGVKNIQQRLAMFYGPDYKLEISSEVGRGTLVRVPLPLEGDKRK